MSKGTFNDKRSNNKHVVMNEIYGYVSKYIKNVNSVVLPSAHPESTLRRLYDNDITMDKSIYCFESNKKTWAKLWDRNRYNGIEQTARRMKTEGYKIVDKNIFFENTNVNNSPITRFMDLDLCGNWLTSRNFSTGMTDAHSPFNIFSRALTNQFKYFGNNWCTLIGTVSLRGTPGGKSTSFEALNGILNKIGHGLTSIDRCVGTYGKGKKISKSGTVHQNGSTYYAYEHNVMSHVNLSPYTTKGMCNAKMKVFTYVDSSPMLAFVLLHKRTLTEV